MTTEAPGFAAMAATTDAHKKLEPFVGTFKAEVTMWMGPGDPMVMTGTMKNTWCLGHRFLHQDYTGDAQEGCPFPAFEGIGYWGYNTAAARYEGVWMDTAGTMMQTEQGQVDENGKVWTMHGQMTCPGAGGAMKKRTVITLNDNDHHTAEMFFTGEDGNEQKSMEISYTRA